MLTTLGAPQRRLLGRSKKPTAVAEAVEAAPVPIARATLIRAEPLSSVKEGELWLDRLRRDARALDAEVDDAARELNAVLRTHRAAAADPYVREVSRAVANAVRVGYGSGDRVADGRFAAAYDLPPQARQGRRAEAMAPLERLAAVLSGTEEVGVAEELVLRARLDLDADRPREAALQARIALEALLLEVPAEHAGELLVVPPGRGRRGERGPRRPARRAAARGGLPGRARDAPGAAARERPLLSERLPRGARILTLVTEHSPSVHGRFNLGA